MRIQRVNKIPSHKDDDGRGGGGGVNYDVHLFISVMRSNRIHAVHRVTMSQQGLSAPLRTHLPRRQQVFWQASDVITLTESRCSFLPHTHLLRGRIKAHVQRVPAFYQAYCRLENRKMRRRRKKWNRVGWGGTEPSVMNSPRSTLNSQPTEADRLQEMKRQRTRERVNDTNVSNPDIQHYSKP